MPRVVIENPVVNSLFDEPRRHVPSRWLSQQFMPIAKPRKKAKERQLTLSEVTLKTVRLLEIWHLPHAPAGSGSAARKPYSASWASRLFSTWSATPFFLRGPGYGEGHLFPRVVSDCHLVDAITAVPQQQVPKCKS